MTQSQNQVQQKQSEETEKKHLRNFSGRLV